MNLNDRLIQLTERYMHETPETPHLIRINGAWYAVQNGATAAALSWLPTDPPGK